MIERLFALLALFGAVLAIVVPPAASAQSAPGRIVAIGDLHGDHDAWRAIARAARIMDQRGRWSGGSTTLVQTGDMVDRGPDSLRIIEDLMRLQRQARRSGGQVVVLTGNHEAMMVTGDLRYVHPGEFQAFVTRQSPAVRESYYQSQRAQIEAAARKRDPKLTSEAIKASWMSEVPLGMIEHQRAWSPSGRLGRWTITNPAVLRLGSTLFVHGGISAEYAALPIEQINRRVAEALAAREMNPDSIINDPAGPLWYRGLIPGHAPPEDLPAPGSITAAAPQAKPGIEQLLDRALEAFKVRRLVIGHTPVLQGIAIDHGGKLVRIDTGISRSYGGALSWLEIIGERVVPHTVPRPTARPGARP